MQIQPLQILLVYYEPAPSGQTAHVLSLAKGLHRDRFHVRVLMPDLLSAAAIRFKAAGIHVELAPIRKLGWRPQAVTRLFQELRRHPNTIVHVHSQEAGLVARPLAKLFGARRIVYTPQTVDIRRKGIQKQYVRAERVLSRITDRIISVNQADHLRLRKWGIQPEKIQTIYNGIQLDEFGPTAQSIELRSNLCLDAQAPLILQIGRLSEQKSPLDFIQGASCVLQKRPDANFIMIGDGPLFGTVRQRILELGLERRIHLLGAREDAYRYIPDADVITLTSGWEGTPYSLLEAMAWARPVVSTAVNGCVDIVTHGKNGFLVPPSQPEAWAEAVLRLIENPLLANSMGQEGRRRVEQEFSIDEMVRRIESLYEDLAWPASSID